MHRENDESEAVKKMIEHRRIPSRSGVMRFKRGAQGVCTERPKRDGEETKSRARTEPAGSGKHTGDINAISSARHPSVRSGRPAVSAELL